MELGVNFGTVSSSQIFLVILNVLIMSPPQRLKRRVGRFRYFKRSEHDNLLHSLTSFVALFACHYILGNIG